MLAYVERSAVESSATSMTVYGDPIGLIDG